MNANMLTMGMNKAQEGAQTAAAMKVTKAAIEKSFVEADLKDTQMKQETMGNFLKVAEKGASLINF